MSLPRDTERYTIRILRDVYAEANEIAKKQNRSFSNYIETLLMDVIKEDKEND